MRHGLALATLLTLAGVVCNQVETRRAPPDRPSILLVTIDTLRADHVGAYGARHVATPSLDGLAAEGVRFDAIASAPVTLPSHAAILTGRHPASLGVRHNGIYRLDEAEETLAERLGAAGYDTAAFVGAFVLDRRFGLAQGFDRYDDETSAQRSAIDGYLERSASEVTDRALAWLARRDRPFFLWVHYYDPHYRYRAPAPFRERYASNPYAGEVAYVDSELGRLLAGLESSGLGQRTLVMVTSDHGESLGEHDEVTHGLTLYDAATHVPLLLRGPGVPGGARVEGVVSHVDLTPTLLDLVGLEPPASADGTSLAPLWREGRASQRVAISESLATMYDVGWSPIFAVRSRRFRYVRAPRPELYDLEADPGELANLLEGDASAHAELLSSLAAPLDAVLASAKDASPTADPEDLERLRALGYALHGVNAEARSVDPKDGLPALRLLDEARDAHEGDRYEEAVRLAEEARARLPESSTAHSLLALVHLHRGRPDLALDPMREAARLAPRHARYRSLLGEILGQLGRTQEALVEHRAAFELDPEDAYARAGLMAGALRGGDLRAAEEHARVALAKSPDAIVQLRVAQLWSAAGRKQRAVATLEETLRRHPEQAFARMLLAIELAGLGREAEAEAAQREAGPLARDPALATRLALAHARAGHRERAEAGLREILRRNPDHAPARRALAQLSGAQAVEEPAAPAREAS